MLGTASRSVNIFYTVVGFLFFCLLSFKLPVIANASTAAADSIHVSSIAGRPEFPGIIFSSAVYFVANSSLTLQGPAGTIAGQSSVTASAFYGDGSHLTGITGIVLTATQSFGGAAVFQSSFSVQTGGRRIVLSTGTGTNNLLIDTNGTISFSPELHNSSATIIPLYSTSNTNLGPCIPGSTLTIVTAGGMVEAEFFGQLIHSEPGDRYFSILQDGQFVRGMTAAKPLLYGQAYFAYPFNYLFEPSFAGAHTYCLTIATDTGTIYLDNREGFTRNQFFIKEIK